MTSLKVLACVALVLANYVQTAARLPVSTTGDAKKDLVAFAREHPDSLRADFRTNGNAIGILASIAKVRGDLSGARELYARASAIRARSGERLIVGGARYFLVVKARIGWNRWVSSEFVEFTAEVPKK